MSIINNAMPMIAVVSVLTAGTDFARIAVEKALPPAIEGQGWIEGPVSPGEIVVANWQIVKRTDCPGESARVWEGELGFYFRGPWGPTSLPTSESVRTYQIETAIPDEAPEGELLLRIIGYYDCPGSAREHFSLGPVTVEVSG